MENTKKKKPLYDRWWFWCIIIFVVFLIIPTGETPSDKEPQTQETVSPAEKETAAPTEQETEAPTEKEIEAPTEQAISYTAITVDELVNALEQNALKAQNLFDGQYLEITGKLDVIDSSGDYIALYPMHEEFCLTSVHCSVMNEEQLNDVMNLTTGENVTVRGKIVGVGELMGYSLNIDEIVK